MTIRMTQPTTDGNRRNGRGLDSGVNLRIVVPISQTMQRQLRRVAYLYREDEPNRSEVARAAMRIGLAVMEAEAEADKKLRFADILVYQVTVK